MAGKRRVKAFCLVELDTIIHTTVFFWKNSIREYMGVRWSQGYQMLPDATLQVFSKTLKCLVTGGIIRNTNRISYSKYGEFSYSMHSVGLVGWLSPSVGFTFLVASGLCSGQLWSPNFWWLESLFFVGSPFWWLKDSSFAALLIDILSWWNSLP